MIDDRDSRIIYSGAGWGDWDEAVNYAGTIKYINNPVGGETAVLEFEGTGIEVVTCTNSDRGEYEVFIDGRSYGKVDTYTPSTIRQKTVFSEDGLEYGKHTIKLYVTNTKGTEASRNTKVELDAFRVLVNTLKKPEKITVSSKSGMTTVGKAGSTLQMQAEVLPEDAKDKSVTWSVSDESLASIDENGLLTVKETNGTVTVTATSNMSAKVAGSVDITIAIAGDVEDVETTVEDGTAGPMDNNGTRSDQITWSDGSWYTWTEAGHSGNTKTEVPIDNAGNIGKWFSYEFSGTGIAMYVHKHENCESYKVEIDGEVLMNGTSDTWPLGSDGVNAKNEKLFEVRDLNNGVHTLKCTIADRADGGRNQANVDCFKVFSPGEGVSVDKADLQTVITLGSEKIEKAYTAASWSAFMEKYAAAVAVMNDADATAAQAAAASEALAAAMNALTETEVAAPVLPDDAKAEVMNIETSRVVVRWTAVPDAVKYRVVYDKATEETTIETADTYCTLTDLTPGTAYAIQIYAVGETGEVSLPLKLDVTTEALPDTEGPAEVTAIKKEAAKDDTLELSWTAPVDEDLAGYEIWLDGQLLETIEDKAVTSCTVENLTEGNTYVFKIVAFDTNGNKSKPTQFSLVFENEKAPVTDREIASVINPEGMEVEYGTDFRELQLPEKVTVNFKTRMTEDLKVVWSKGDYDGTAAKTYTLEGEIQLTEGIINPDAVKAEIKVTVKPQEVIPPEPEKPSKDALQGKVDEVKMKAEENYTTAVWEKFTEALDSAKAVLADENATEKEIQKALDQLNAAVEEMDAELELRGAFQKFYDECKAYYEEADYSKALWKEYKEAMNTAEKVLADKESSAETMVEALEDLIAVTDKMNAEDEKEDEKPSEEKPSEEKPSEDPKSPVKPQPPVKPELPETGDSSNAVPVMILFALGAVIAVAAGRRRKTGIVK